MINKLFFIGMSMFILALTSCSMVEGIEPSTKNLSTVSTVSIPIFKDGTNGTNHDLIIIVLDTSNIAVSNAASIFANSNGNLSATTDSEGKALIEDVPAETYELSVWQNNIPQVIESTQLSSNPTLLSDTLLIHLIP